MNGYHWQIKFVDPYNPLLVDRTDTLTVATTDPLTSCVYISDAISGSFLTRVLIHELGHCAIFSYHLLDDIHQMIKPKYWIEAEEWVCNFIADYGFKIFDIAYSVLGNNAWVFIPYWLDHKSIA